ncbi:transposase, partial [Clostridioides difficile]|uniref:transposase n=1 Tax=Clostridioides difficile TaxID=1496 RepID=UPI001FD89CAE
SKKHKPTGRTYSCTCGYKTHRDIVGAWNILMFNFQSSFHSINFFVLVILLLLVEHIYYNNIFS